MHALSYFWDLNLLFTILDLDRGDFLENRNLKFSGKSNRFIYFFNL